MYSLLFPCHLVSSVAYSSTFWIIIDFMNLAQARIHCGSTYISANWIGESVHPILSLSPLYQIAILCNKKWCAPRNHIPTIHISGIVSNPVLMHVLTKISVASMSLVDVVVSLQYIFMNSISASLLISLLIQVPVPSSMDHLHCHLSSVFFCTST